MTRIFVPRDALSIAVGADEVADAIRQACPDAVIVRNGSRGMAWLEPLVEVPRHRRAASATDRLQPRTSQSLVKAGLPQRR